MAERAASQARNGTGILTSSPKSNAAAIQRSLKSLMRPISYAIESSAIAAAGDGGAPASGTKKLVNDFADAFDLRFGHLWKNRQTQAFARSFLRYWKISGFVTQMRV